MKKGDEEVTIWKRKNEEGEWQHNHIEKGWNYNPIPDPIANTEKERKKQTNAWKNMKWRRSWGYIKDGKVVEIVKAREV